jgi:hypothetical protein
MLNTESARSQVLFPSLLTNCPNYRAIDMQKHFSEIPEMAGLNSDLNAGISLSRNQDSVPRKKLQPD